ncbi:immunoglobulin-like domain-containing protein [Paenibacillus agri]|uniref:S-layer homology domain-containing protein n=1 Tax=Paenibacillus agri TaxID=2744309 RepID=A0A850EK13_9BACL|nr:immunoglobulin-like domain-containing protein [Paenibacillus agri]NUU59777.1 S-layer homology domain-containing protein [Paenibacillus agri]
MQKKKVRSLLTATLAVMTLGQNLSLPTAYGASTEPMASPPADSNGKWMTGEYHVHTYESDDAQESLKDVLDTAFDKNGLDWLFLADHLRMSGRDHEGVPLPGGSIPMSKGIIDYQTPIIKELQASGKYAGKTIFSGFEWDMPQYDHAAIGIVTNDPGSAASLKAVNQFEYLFTNRAENLFDPADVAKWAALDNRAFSTKADTRKGIQWLSDHYPESYMLINHPSRKNGGSSELKIEDVRDFNNIDPHVAFGFEGMLGNQMSPDRGETAEVYGGTDVKVAKVGGFWDALLGEGRRFWNFANSDFHFKTSKDNKYSSGYWPGEYSKNYTWVNGSSVQNIVDGMRSGKSFSVFGDLINALDFKASGDGREEAMGGELAVKQGDNVEVTIRFKSPAKNNNGDAVSVDHVDLISGEVGGKVQPGTPEYSKPTNDTTKVVARFTSADWTTDAEGYNVITYKPGAADKSRYYRLRGTNLGLNVPGETKDGEPLLDVKNNTADNATRFQEINNRNYGDLWFYSNPVFVNVEPYTDQQAVEDTAAALKLDGTNGVIADLKLPAEGQHGAKVQWESTNAEVIRVADGIGYITRPAAGQPDAVVSLKATVSRGAENAVKTFEVTVKAKEYTDVEAVQLAKEKLTLGDLSAVKSDLYLPAAGVQGTSIVWESSNPVLMTKEGKLAFRPKKDTSITLTATILRGNASEVKTFEVNLSGDDSITPLELSGVIQSADGAVQPSGAWINQDANVSVIASVYVPGTTVALQVSLDGSGEFQPYETNHSLKITAEGQHTLEFRATDSLGNTAVLPLAVNIDRTAPVITLKGSSTISLTQGDSFVDPGAEVTDKLGIAGSIVVSGSVDTGTPGTYKLQYNAKDLAGNNAVEVVRTVNVSRSGSGNNGNDNGNSGNGNSGNGNGGTPTPAPTVTPTPAPSPTPGNTTKPSTEAVELQVNALQGGAASLKDAADLKIPAGALTADSKVALKPVALPTGGTLTAASSGVEITSTNAGLLNKPVELTLVYDKNKITSGHKAAVYYYSEQRNKWIYVGGTDNANGNVTASINHFSTYAVFNYQALPMTDLNNHWAEAYTDRLIGMGVMKGFDDHSFRPDEKVTRTQFATLIARALGLQSSGNAASFADQEAIPAWAAGDIAAAVEAGIIRGYEVGDKTIFKGSEVISRAEMSVMLANALNSAPHKKTSDSITFTDRSAIPQWAAASIETGAAAGILGGFEDQTFRPEHTATRGEAATAIYRLLDALSI